MGRHRSFRGAEDRGWPQAPLGSDLWRIALAKRPLGSQKRPSLTRAGWRAFPVGTPRRIERVSRPATHPGANGRTNLGIVAALPREPPPHQFEVVSGGTAGTLDSGRERQHRRLEASFRCGNDARFGPRYPSFLGRACASGLVRMRHRHRQTSSGVFPRAGRRTMSRHSMPPMRMYRGGSAG